MAGPAAAQSTAPLPWGDPNLEGSYTTDNWIGVPFSRPERYGTSELLPDDEYAARVAANEEQLAKDYAPEPESEFSTDDPASINAPRHWLERPDTPARATSLIVAPANGRLPAMTAAGEAFAAARRGEQRRPPESYTDFSNYNRCITRGLTGSIIPVIYGNGVAIHQAPGYVVIRSEMIHEARVIPLDGRPHANPAIKMWMGDSRGHFEGDTLVIETTNFTDRTGIGSNGGGAVHSEDMRLTERLTRIDADTVHYEFTVDDPAIYTEPWTVRFDLYAKPGYKLYEYACHEGNYGLANMLSAARAEERASE
ncbi:MAG: hypothetical protein R3305_06385 [Gammaproteobacteria bacterium]|nr:hypothetical protein [Gammaproteobacteria bacterium]